jgi:hypothetical protein
MMGAGLQEVGEAAEQPKLSAEGDDCRRKTKTMALI